MKSFAVRLSQNGGVCQIAVDEVANARWLLGRLNQFYMFRSGESSILSTDVPPCTIAVVLDAEMTLPRLQRMLQRIPEVLLTQNLDTPQSAG